VSFPYFFEKRIHIIIAYSRKNYNRKTGGILYKEEKTFARGLGDFPFWEEKALQNG
jgi:hypothetical protein